TASSAGIEREQIHNRDERLMFPTRLSKDFQLVAGRVIDQMRAIQASGSLQIQEQIDNIESEAWAAISELYEMTTEERELVSYASDVSMLYGKSHIFGPVTRNDIEQYFKPIQKHFSKVTKAIGLSMKFAFEGSRESITRAIHIRFGDDFPES